MWKKNLLFLAVCLLGVGVMGRLVLPSVPPKGVDEKTWKPIPKEAVTPDLVPVVGKVDESFRQVWQAEGIAVAEPAPVEAVVRRLSLALVGSVPSIEELHRLETVSEGERIDRHLEQLLADPRYSIYFAERLARSYVGTDGGPFILYRRRRFVSWLTEELARNTAYDQIVRKMVTAEGVWTDQPEVNFFTAAIKPDTNENPNINQLTTRTARAFLGIRMDCAECHDHPFDRWKQADFQGLSAFYYRAQRSGPIGIRERGGELELADPATEKKKVVPPIVPFAAELLPSEGSRRDRFAHWLTHPENQPFSRAIVNRVWALLFGRGLVEPVDDMRLTDEYPAALDLVADDFVNHGYDLRRLIRVIAKTEVFRLDSRLSAEDQGLDQEESWAVFPVTKLRPEQVAAAVIQASQLGTIDQESPLVVRIIRNIGEAQFRERHGDAGREEMDPHEETIPQQLLMMNGNLVKQQTDISRILGNAPSQIAVLASSDQQTIELVYQALLTRNPEKEELEHFVGRLQNVKGRERHRCVEDIYWTLINSTEFSWNH